MLPIVWSIYIICLILNVWIIWSHFFVCINCTCWEILLKTSFNSAFIGPSFMKIRPQITSGEFWKNFWFCMIYIEKNLCVPILLARDCRYFYFCWFFHISCEHLLLNLQNIWGSQHFSDTIRRRGHICYTKVERGII